LADRRESHFGADVTVGRGRGELGDRLNGGKAVVLERIAPATLLLLLLGGHLGTDAGCTILAEAAGINGWRRDIVTVVGAGLHGNGGKSGCEINFHLLGVRLDLRVRVLANGAANAVRRMSSTG
jgi:hypothetical protein